MNEDLVKKMTKSEDNGIYKLELLKFVSDMGEREQDRLWRAFSHMLTLNGGLFALFGLLVREGINDIKFLRTLTVVGAMICIASIQVVRYAKFHAKRWHDDACFLIEKVLKVDDLITARTGPRYSSRPRPYFLIPTRVIHKQTPIPISTG